MSTLSLNDIVNVSVTVGPVSTVRTNFNVGLIIGPSTVISTSTRVKTYSKMSDMDADDWDGTEQEYLAAAKYFQQTKRPTKVVIGRWDTTGSETAAQAVAACRVANTEWYACTVCDSVKADIIAVANYIEACEPTSTYFYTTSDSDVLAGTAGNVMETLKNNKIHRSLGQYSTTVNAAAAIMGYAMGANDSTANSAYTLAYKGEVGVTAENLTSSQVTIIQGLNGNTYLNRGSVYNIFEPGKMADGSYFDEVINIDMLTNSIQVAAMNALTSENKISQTDDGLNNLLNYITAPLETARTIGFISAGTWNVAGILSVNKGDSLPRGYKILAGSIADQSQTDREARKSPPIYILIKLAGAIQHVAISVYVNR
ncbi:DUF3383 family protein [Clostridium saccharoperbutylacetonicum]|uniref:DUF3383 family protein n=1 Tax=Clostridium saccharoperbutylacetonicum TaxID=36745 RepID=UPI0039E7E66C